MDVLDAGVYVTKWEADVAKEARLVLWGPIQAREMGLDGWEFQDGGETGFVAHNAGVHLTMGRATSTLVYVRRLQKAWLTVYFGGYPADAPVEQRRLDMQKVISACQMFMTRLAKCPIHFTLQGEITLVDNLDDGTVEARPKVMGTVTDPRIPLRGEVVDAEESTRAKRVSKPGDRAEVWEV